MNALAEPGRKHYRARQRGQAMILIAVMLVLGVMTAVYATVSSTSVSIANRQAVNTGKVLAEVKDALNAWSAARTPTGGSPNIRPGELPCPDNDNSGTDAGACVAGAIGRVPWKSLGIPEPKDGAGETLWYAIAGPFRNYAMNNAPITSNTQGNLTVYHGSSATTITSYAVAVLIAPGAALGSQDRSSSMALCSTTGTTIARNLCAANYLESTGGGNNAQTGGPFVQAAASSSFNDRVLAITNEDLMPLVEQRVAREIIAILNQYRAATATSPSYPGGVYPWGSLVSGNSSGSPGTAYNHNRFPCSTAQPVDWGIVPAGGTTSTPTLPNWLKNGCWSTSWTSLVYYAVSRNILEVSGVTCTTCSAASLTITNPSIRIGTVCSTNSSPACTTGIVTAGTADLLLITPGGYTGAPARNWPSTWNAITGYFEDAENFDNNNPNNDTYTVPTATSPNRDRIYIVR